MELSRIEMKHINSTPTTLGHMSFLRWAGSKRQIIPKLHRYWCKAFERYIEPFAGSASLFFTIQPKSAILGDLNADLIETLRVVKSSPSHLSILLRSLRRGKRAYYAIRQQNPRSLLPVERAARFIYLRNL